MTAPPGYYDLRVIVCKILFYYAWILVITVPSFMILMNCCENASSSFICKCYFLNALNSAKSEFRFGFLRKVKLFDISHYRKNMRSEFCLKLYKMLLLLILKHLYLWFYWKLYNDFIISFIDWMRLIGLVSNLQSEFKKSFKFRQ